MRERPSFESRITKLSLIASLPLLLLSIGMLLYAQVSVYLILLCVLVGSLLVIICNGLIYQKSSFQFRSLSNLLDAMIRGDYTMRGRQEQNDSALNELVISINDLAEHLSQQRLKSTENQLLLNTVVQHIDLAIVSIDQSDDLSCLNPAADRLLSKEYENYGLEAANTLTAIRLLQPGESQVMALSFGGQKGRFKVHLEVYRRAGIQHRLVFIADVANILRQEEERAWKNLVRVLSHEINNSLTPIASISQTLEKIARSSKGLSDNRDDLREGLALISQRSRGLRDFVNSYRELSKLPEPKRQIVALDSLAEKLERLFGGDKLSIISSESIELRIDATQIEQVLINLIKNGLEASQKDSARLPVMLSWSVKRNVCIIYIRDCGMGIQNTDNLFVPFYTTKPSGSGIGLALSRQIIEAHKGELSLNNRTDRAGCIAAVRLPLI